MKPHTQQWQYQQKVKSCLTLIIQCALPPFCNDFYLLQRNFIFREMNDRFSDLVSKWWMSVKDLHKSYEVTKSYTVIYIFYTAIFHFVTSSVGGSAISSCYTKIRAWRLYKPKGRLD